MIQFCCLHVAVYTFSYVPQSCLTPATPKRIEREGFFFARETTRTPIYVSSAINASAEKASGGENPLLTAFGSKGTKALVAKTTSPENNSDDDGNKIAVACELKNEEKNKNIHVCVCVWQYTCRVCWGGEVIF